MLGSQPFSSLEGMDFIKLYIVCFQMLVTFLRCFLEEMSVCLTQPTHFIFGAVKDTGNIFHRTQNQVRRQSFHLTWLQTWLTFGNTVYFYKENPIIAVISHFSSKGQLFYSSNLLLSNPVPPSIASQPKRVRCKYPYTAAYDTDELTVTFGEILIVHHQPEPQSWKYLQYRIDLHWDKDCVGVSFFWQFFSAGNTLYDLLKMTGSPPTEHLRTLFLVQWKILPVSFILPKRPSTWAGRRRKYSYVRKSYKV